VSEKDIAPDAPKDGLKGALVEVYNNTKTREEFVIPSLETPDFKVDLIKGNHYTILIRKNGFLSKRMEAFVDVEGCILCFEGIGNVTPGVSDNLSEANTIGVLLANVEMDRYFEGKVIGLNDIYYDYGKADITPKAAGELDKVVDFLRDNPRLNLELGSHTDSRGKASSNLKLSQRRAKAAVDYLVDTKGISSTRVQAKGYGETDLTNKCKDGVECDEKEHLLNRRTELKVLDVEEGGNQRALRQMKADELMEEILAGIDASGQVKVAAGDDVESTIKKAQENSKDKISSRKFEDYDGKSSTPQKEVVVETKSVLVEKKPEGIQKSIEIVEEVEVKKTPQVIKEGKGLAKGEIEKTVVEEKPLPKEVNLSKIQEEAPPAAVNLDEVNNDDFKAPSLTSSSERYSETYTGFKVVAIYSRFELSLDHHIYNTYDDVDIYTTADGNKLYMLGSFNGRIEAERAMRKIYKKEYPQSYVIGFEEGNRVY